MKYFLGLLSVVILAGAIPTLPLWAQETPGRGEVILLEPGIIHETTGAAVNYQTYLGKFFYFIITIAVILAVWYIILLGLQYIMSWTALAKFEAKGRLWSIVGGLILVLSAYLILKTINPDLVNIQLRVGDDAAVTAE